MKRFRTQDDEVYEGYEKVHTLNYDAIERVCELTFLVNGTMAFIRIENIHDVRFYKPQKVVYFIGSGNKFDIQFKPPAKKVEINKGSVLVG